MRNKQEELEILAQSKSYDIIGITITWLQESCDWCVIMEDYRLFRKDGQGRRGTTNFRLLRELVSKVLWEITFEEMKSINPSQFLSITS